MATDPSPTTSEQVTASPPAPASPTAVTPSPAEVNIPLPPPAAVAPPTPSPEGFAHLLRRLDRMLALLVVLFAFLVASFPAANSDFLQHLAAGRRIAHGEAQVGVDPFTYTTEGVYWVNHSWLFDLLFYGLYQLPQGGVVVVVLKALLVALLAVLMLRTGARPGQSLWTPAACTALAVLALSPRLLLQPAVFSLFFLGITLWLLRRPRQRREAAVAGEAGARSPYRSFWLLPPLFLLWANVDTWFVLGPLTVVLYLLGEALGTLLAPDAADGPAPGELRTLALALGAGLVACLVNPSLWRVFALPPDLGLSAAGDILADDNQFSFLFYSPLQRVYYTRFALNAAGLAYYPLVLLGVVSFALSWGRWHGGRVAVWLGFVALSFYNARTIPFFAVVAGPLTALNFLDFAAHRFGTVLRLDVRWRRWSVLGRAFTLVLAVALLVATVPGWLQARPHEAHRVGWGVRLDPSLRQMALRLKAWRDEGLIGPDDHLFNTAPQVVDYLAWFCPGERGFLDHRLPLFGGVAQDYLDARRSLAGKMPAETTSQGSTVRQELAWRRVFRRHHVRFLVLSSRGSNARDLTAYGVLFLLPGEWAPCYLDGRTAIFGWKDPRPPRQPDPYKRLRLDRARLAFGPGAEQAPGQGPRPPEPRRWWEALYKPERPRALASDEAFLHLFHYRTLAETLWPARNRHAWEAATAAATVAVPAPGGASVWPGLFLPQVVMANESLRRQARSSDRGFRGRAVVAQGILRAHLGTQDAGPVSLLYLALRAGRRGVAENPDDANAWFVLGEAYAHLMTDTREAGIGRLRSVTLLRHVQAITAFTRSARLDPDSAQTHEALARLYERALYLAVHPRDPNPWRGNVEKVVYHRTEQLRCLRAGGPQPGQDPEAYNRYIEELERILPDLKDDLARRQDQYELQSGNRPPLLKAQIALDLGLAETALKVLQEADAKDLLDPRAAQLVGMFGVSRQLELLLSMGRLEEARETFNEDNVKVLRSLGILPELGLFQAADWFPLELAAAAGDYDDADRILGRLRKQLARVNAAALLARPVGSFLLMRATQPPILLGAVLAEGNLNQALGGRMGLMDLLRFRADVAAVRGTLALEAGDTANARRDFGNVLDLCLPRARCLPPLATLGAATPFEAAALLAVGRHEAAGPFFPLPARPLALIGRQRLEAAVEPTRR